MDARTPLDADPFDDPTIGRRHEGTLALVTGAASGIGRAAARRLAAEGASVWCADVNAEGVADTAATIEARGGIVRSSVLDVTDPDACAATVAAVVDDFGGLDVLANIAGIGSMVHTVDETVDRYRRIMAVNIDGPVYLTIPALPHLLARKGNIMNLASTAGVIGQAYVAAYAASKHALVGFTKALAIEYGKEGLRVNAVCPGGVRTNIIDGFQPPEDADFSLVERAFLVPRLQKPESIAATIAYVTSREAYYVNGSVIVVDGGTSTG